MLEESFDFRLRFLLEKIRAGGNQYFYHPNTVGTGAAVCFFDLPFCFRSVPALWRNQVKVQVGSAVVNIRIAFVAFLGSFVVGVDLTDLRAFVFGKTHDGVLGCTHTDTSMKNSSDSDSKRHVPGVHAYRLGRTGQKVRVF